MAKPPAPPPPPPAKKKHPPQNQQTAINTILKTYPGYRQWMPTIRNAAIRWGIDPVFVLATLAWENGSADPNAVSSAGALGLAQVVDTRVNPSANSSQYKNFLRSFGEATDANKKNPVWAINYLAWRMAGHIRQYGSLGQAYDKGYNPGFTGDSRGPGPQALVPGYYMAQAGQPQSPQATAGKAVDVSAAKQAITDPWVVIGPQGRMKFSFTETAPKNAVKYAGLPMTRSQFLQAWQGSGGINDQYQAYTGKNATPQQVAYILRDGISTYTLQQRLAKSPAFYHSPVWKTRAPDYVAAWHSIYGNRSKPDRTFIANAIARNVSGSAFTDQLRQRQDYTGSMEFKQNAVTMRQAYEQIYGTPDNNALAAIRQATLNGWTTDQFQQYLRNLPEYSHSAEYRTKVLTFLDAIGSITGHVATMQAGNPIPQGGQGTGQLTGTPGYGGGAVPPGQKPPYDPRLPPANAPVPAGSGYTVNV